MIISEHVFLNYMALHYLRPNNRPPYIIKFSRPTFIMKRRYLRFVIPCILQVRSFAVFVPLHRSLRPRTPAMPPTSSTVLPLSFAHSKRFAFCELANSLFLVPHLLVLPIVVAVGNGCYVPFCIRWLLVLKRLKATISGVRW